MKDAAVVYSERSGWYLRGDYSYAWSDAGELARPIVPFGSLSIDNTWALGGGIGRYFGRGVRGDVTYEWRGSTDVHGTGPGTLTTDFDLKSSVLLANLYYDFRPNERFTPYVGIGVGAARHSTSGGTIQTACALLRHLRRRQQLVGGRRPDGGRELPHRPRPPRPRQHQGRAAATCEPGRLHVDVGYRFLYLGDAHTGNLVGTTCRHARPAPRRHHGARASRRPAVGHPLAATRAPGPDSSVRRTTE